MIWKKGLITEIRQWQAAAARACGDPEVHEVGRAGSWEENLEADGRE